MTNGSAMVDENKEAEPSESSERLRTVNDYSTEDELRSALMNMEIGSNGEREAPPESRDVSEVVLKDEWDWVLTNYDVGTTIPQTLEEELHRLQVLKSYLILDTKRDACFDRLTGIACRIFEVPIALVSLVDIGRQWFKSNRGLGEVRETPRNLAFCAHAIQGKSHIFVVPDTLEDFRFRENALVTGAPYIRFYAGAPLISPEGFKLGTFCVIDSKPRPNGLSSTEEANLLDLAAATVSTMSDRRRLANQDDPERLLACTAHDMLTPLTGLQLSLSLLQDDQTFQKRIDAQHKDCISNAVKSADIMLRICQRTIDTIRQSSGSRLSNSRIVEILARPASSPVVDMKALVKSLHTTIDPIPKRVPLVITVDSSVPSKIVGDDLKIFRSAVNLLTQACVVTETGSIHLKIFRDKDDLVFECEDTGPDLKDGYNLFEAPKPGEENQASVGLYSMASQIDSLGGRHGFRYRGRDKAGNILKDDDGRALHGSVLWFRIPIVLPAGLVRDGSISSLDKEEHLSAIRSVESFTIKNEESLQERHRNYSGIMAVAAAAAKNMQKASRRSACVDSPHGHPNGILRPVLSRSCVNSVDKDRFKSLKNARFEGSGSGASLDRKRPWRLGKGDPFDIEKKKEDSALKSKALVIEDSVVVRKCLVRALNKLGYEVTQADNGMEGLRELKRVIFDVTLCDFLMPVMDGLDCVQQYRAWEKVHRSSSMQYIIGISAHAGHKDIEKGLEIGMNDFKPKPITFKVLSELTSKISTLEQKKRKEAVPSTTANTESSGTIQSLKMDGRNGARLFDTVKESKEGDSDAVDNSIGKEEKTEEQLRGRKRMKLRDELAGGDLIKPYVDKVCLLATEMPTEDSRQIIERFDRMGWQVVVVGDGMAALQQLKLRNWDAVLLDESLPKFSGSKCVSFFRSWEKENRVNRQSNVFHVCSTNIPSFHDRNTIVQPPAGFDGTLDRRVRWNDFDYLIKKACRNGSNVECGAGLHIVTR